MMPFQVMRRGSGTIYTPDYGSYTTLDSGDKDSTITLSGSNLVATKSASTGAAYAYAAHGKATGKWHFQVTVTTAPSSGELTIGLVGALFLSYDLYIGRFTSSIGINHNAAGGGAGVITNGSTQYSGGITLPSGTVVDVYADITNDKVWFAKDGVVLNGSPSAGTGGTTMTSGMTKGWIPALYMHGPSQVVTCNFGPTTNKIPGFQKWSDEPAPASKSVWRTFALRIRSLGFFSHSWSEIELMPNSGGTNHLSGATVTCTASTTGGNALSASNDGTFGAQNIVVGNTGVQNQFPCVLYFEQGSSATRNDTHFARGAGGNMQQTINLMDLWFSTGTVASGPFFKGAQGIAFTTPTVAGQRQETTL